MTTRYTDLIGSITREGDAYAARVLEGARHAR